MQTSTEVNELYAALAKAQKAMRSALKDAENEAFSRSGKKSKYADLAAVWDAIRDPLTDNGLSVMQDVTVADAKVSVTTRLAHASGQWADFGPIVVPMAKTDAHGVGSATSYGRRYSVSAAVGVVQDDDDGNAATGKPAKPAEPEPADAETADLIRSLESTAKAKGIDAYAAAWALLTAEQRTSIGKDGHARIKALAQKRDAELVADQA